MPIQSDFCPAFCSRFIACSLLCGSMMIVTACGGGGSSTAAPPPVANVPLALNLSDSFTAGVLTGDGSGLWSGSSGGDGGAGDGGGAAGDGEFVKVKMRFPYAGQPNGTLTWTVLRSQYGITGSTGNLTIQADASGAGGYKVTAVNGSAAAVSAGQGNFFVSKSGQLSGMLPLPIKGGQNNLFNGVRFKDGTSSATDMSEIAGTYVWGATGSDLTTGANPDITGGSLKINADGSGRSCSGVFAWSANCTNGLDLLATFDDPASRNLIRVKAAATQSQPIAAGGATAIDMLAVARKFGNNGVSLTADFVVTRTGTTSRTGAMYASRQGSAPSNPADFTGAWNYTGRSIQNPLPTGSAYFAIANVSGVIKANGGLNAATCMPPDKIVTFSAGPVNGVVTGTRPVPFPGEGPSYAIQLDTDMTAIVTPASELGLARRYSVDPTKAPCQPS